MEQYTVHASARDGAALFFAMMPQLLEDEECRENCKAYQAVSYTHLDVYKRQVAGGSGILSTDAVVPLSGDGCFFRRQRRPAGVEGRPRESLG